MIISKSLGMRLPEYIDPADIEVINSNLKKLEGNADEQVLNLEEVKKLLNSKAAAEPSKTYEFPVVSGIILNYGYFAKDQFNNLIINASITLEQPMEEGNTTIGVMPVGFRPQVGQAAFGCAELRSHIAGITSGVIRVGSNGTVYITKPTEISIVINTISFSVVYLCL